MLEKACRWITQDVLDYYETFREPVRPSQLLKRAQRLLKKIDLTPTEIAREASHRGYIGLFVTADLTRWCLPPDIWGELDDEGRMAMVTKYSKGNRKHNEEGDKIVSESKSLPTSSFFSDKSKENKIIF